jgi:hypothetical protein
MSGRIKEIVDRLVEWASANKDVIATRIERIMMQMVELLEKVGPLLGDTVDMFSKLVDQVGGLDKALYGAGAAWAAWQFAAMAAINPVSAALASLTAGMALGAAAAGYAQSFVVKTNNLRASETARFNDAARLLDAPSSGTDDENEARAFLEQSLINFGLLTQGDTTKIRSDDLQSAIDEQLAEIDRASTGLKNFTGLSMGPAEPTPAQAAASFELGKIAKPGAKSGAAAVTSASEIAAAEKRARELDRDRRIRSELETMRATAEGPRRMAIESALRDVEQRISGGKPKGLNELIAEAVGQGTGLGSGALRPAGLGTTINNIDASVFFNLGGIEVTAEVAGAVSSQAQAAGRSVGEAVIEVLRPMLNEAFQTQRGQILG